MEINKILQADYLDLLFDNRNKNYGSYDLRKHYQSRALKALGITFSLLALAVAVPYVLNRIIPAKAVAALVLPTDRTVEIEKIFIETITPPSPPQQPAKTHNPSVAKTIQSTEPVIAKNNDVRPDIKPPKIEDLEHAVAGAITTEGNGGTKPAITTTPPVGPPGAGGGTHDGKTGGEDVKDVIATAPDVMPEYPGGMAALLAYLQSNMRYPNEARMNNIQGRVIVRFVVNAKGKIEDATIQKGLGYGCDKEALRVVNAMKDWKPGQVKGKPIKAYYTLPITFKME